MRRISLALLLITSSGWSAFGQSGGDGSAWDRLVREQSESAARASAAERSVLMGLTWEQLMLYLNGGDPEEIVLADGQTLGQLLASEELALAPIHLSWWTVDGGGGESSGATFFLMGTMGQPDAGECRGGRFEVRGGFWAAFTREIFLDGFETGDDSYWSATTGGGRSWSSDPWQEASK